MKIENLANDVEIKTVDFCARLNSSGQELFFIMLVFQALNLGLAHRSVQCWLD